MPIFPSNLNHPNNNYSFAIRFKDKKRKIIERTAHYAPRGRPDKPDTYGHSAEQVALYKKINQTIEKEILGGSPSAAHSSSGSIFGLPDQSYSKDWLQDFFQGYETDENREPRARFNARRIFAKERIREIAPELSTQEVDQKTKDINKAGVKAKVLHNRQIGRKPRASGKSRLEGLGDLPEVDWSGYHSDPNNDNISRQTARRHFAYEQAPANLSGKQKEAWASEEIKKGRARGDLKAHNKKKR